MSFYKNIKLEKLDDGKFLLVIKIDEVLSHTFTLSADQLEHILSSYRNYK